MFKKRNIFQLRTRLEGSSWFLPNNFTSPLLVDTAVGRPQSFISFMAVSTAHSKIPSIRSWINLRGISAITNVTQKSFHLKDKNLGLYSGIWDINDNCSPEETLRYQLLLRSYWNQFSAIPCPVSHNSFPLFFSVFVVFSWHPCIYGTSIHCDDFTSSSSQ